MDGRGSITGTGKIFLLSAASCPTQWVPRAITQVVKRPGREADHSHPPRVNNGGAIPPLTICLHGIVLN
jgi:hypothetical protein